MAKLGLPPLKAVRAFEAAARRGSFVEAAADLNVTHWAVGKQIRLLEDWLGVPLLERRSRGVVLTDEGAELLDDVSAAFFRLSEATARLRRPDVTRRVSGLVRVNVQPSFALRWLFPRLPAFQNLFPQHRCPCFDDIAKTPVHRNRVRYRGSLRAGKAYWASLRDPDARSAAPGLQSAAFAQTSGGQRARSSPPHDSPLRYDPICLVALAVSSGHP
jgi:molybdenum-dependent DNA-binding transcriptional regulator ModE